MEEIKSVESRLLQTALLEVGNLVCTEVPAAAIFPPAVVLSQSADGEAFFGDRLPVLALGFVGERDLVLRDGDDQGGVSVCLLLGGGKALNSSLLAALLEGIRLVEALR